MVRQPIREPQADKLLDVAASTHWTHSLSNETIMGMTAGACVVVAFE